MPLKSAQNDVILLWGFHLKIDAILCHDLTVNINISHTNVLPCLTYKIL